MITKDKLLLESKAWALEKLSYDNNYFEQLDGRHNPNILWIASSDSLVPPHELINAEPGEVLIYSNLGLQIQEDDAGAMAIIEEALLVYNVKIIVICGYSNCNSIKDVIEGKEKSQYSRQWLKNLRLLYEKNKVDFDKLASTEDKVRLLSELNIKEQVSNISNLPIVQKEWEKRDEPLIYGWHFDLKLGSLTEITSLERNHKAKPKTAYIEA